MNTPKGQNTLAETPSAIPTGKITSDVNAIIWPTRTLQDIIDSEPLANDEGADFWNEVYVISKDECRTFEQKIGSDILPEDGMVILVKEDQNSDNVQIEIVSQDMANRVMETKGFHDLHHYFSLQHPQGFYHDREEM